MIYSHLKLGLAAVLGFSSAWAPAQVQVPTYVDCVDHEHRFFLKDFTLSQMGNLGSLTFIDSFERHNLKLFCGYDPSGANRTEIACTSSHFGGDETIIRARVHMQKDEDLPNVAVIEVQNSTVPSGSIDSMIPLVCR